MRAMLRKISQILVIGSYLAVFVFLFFVHNHYFSTGFRNGGFERGLQAISADLNKVANPLQQRLDRYLGRMPKQVDSAAVGLAQPEFDLKGIAPRLLDFSFRGVSHQRLMQASVQVNSCGFAFVEKGAARPTKLQLEKWAIYVLKSRNLLDDIAADPCAESHGKAILIFEYEKKIVGLIEVDAETMAEGLFSLLRFKGENFPATLVWSLHTGGADMQFDHFLIDLSENGSVNIQSDFLKYVGDSDILRIGNVKLTRNAGDVVAEADSRGRFLTLPNRPLFQNEMNNLISDLNFKFSPSFLIEPHFPHLHKSHEPFYVLMQMDGSRVDFTPIRAERYVYKVIQWHEGEWKDASHTPAARAFYRAVADSIFKELSVQDGEIRNWMLGSWVSYKALLGEWNEAREILVKKLDTLAARRQMCVLLDEINKLGKNISISELKTRYILNEARKIKKSVHSDCDPPEFVDFVEWEVRERGMTR